MAGPRAMAAIMNKTPFEVMDGAIAGIEKKAAALTPLEAMNNADSYGMFVMWVSDRL
jgi:hypothetical protein